MGELSCIIEYFLTRTKTYAVYFKIFLNADSVFKSTFSLGQFILLDKLAEDDIEMRKAIKYEGINTK